MKLKYSVMLAFVVFLVSLLISALIVQVQTQNLTETRKSALITKLSQSQFEDGSFPHFVYENETCGDPYGTAMTLYIFKALGELDKIDVEKAIDYIISRQNCTVGNQTLWCWPVSLFGSDILVGEPYSVFVILDVLKAYGVLDRVNRTALINFALSRYNETDGSFHEPVIKYKTSSGEEGEEAVCAFPLEFPGGGLSLAFARANIISTFLGVSILANLDALDRINTTKTLKWIMACKAKNEAFMPFPASGPEYLPGWTRLCNNPFYVDRNGTGIAYTYAAVGALKTLGVNIKNVIDVKKTTKYVLSCRLPGPYGTLCFLAHPDDTHLPDFSLSYYAIMTLHYIGTLKNETETASKAAAYPIKCYQSLLVKDTWPIPTRKFPSTYGLFVDLPPLRTTYISIAILNVTGNLHLLDEPTPIVWKTWQNLLELSTLTSISALSIFIITTLTYNKLKTWKHKAKPENAQNTLQIKRCVCM